MTAFPMLETKFCPLDAVAESGAAPDGRLEGYAAIFGEADQGGDVIAPGAFAKTLAARRGASVKLLWQHDPSEPIGVWSEMREDAKGLFVRGRLLLETRRGREAAALLVSGALDGLSIGYRAVKAEKTSGGRRLTEIDLWEISVVTFPMMPGARVTPEDDGAAFAMALQEASAALRM